MNEPYSRPLSERARALLVDWIETYLVSLQSSTADRKAELSKQKAIELLSTTDIDILVFITTINVMHSPHGLTVLDLAMSRVYSCRDVALALVQMMTEAFKRDKQARAG